MNNENYSERDIIIRKANQEDNFADIAQLIYETDEYIYPYWFHDSVEEARKVLPSLMKEEGFFFNYKSIYVAIDKNTNKIVGFVCIVEPETNLDYNYEELINSCRSYEFTIKNYIMKLIEEIKELQLPYISNVCVNKEYRGRKIAQTMLNKILEEKKPYYRKFLLDCLKDNPSALRVYQKLGFEITDFYMDIGYGPDNFTETYSMELDTTKHSR